MFMSHSMYASVWMTHPLQLLQVQVLRGGFFRPGHRRQSLQAGGATNGPTTVAPPPLAASEEAEEESPQRQKTGKKTS